MAAIQRGAAHPAAHQRRAEGGERTVARRAAGHVTRTQGDEGGSGKHRCPSYTSRACHSHSGR